METNKTKKASTKGEHQKPTPQECRSKILEIITKNKTIDRQDAVQTELEKFFKCKFRQPDISKDFKALKIEKRKNGIGFEILESRTVNSEKLKKIANECYFTSDDVCADFKTMIIKSQNITQSHILGNHLKIMYADIIVDVICNENSVIVYYKDAFVFRNMTLKDDLENYFPDSQL